LTSLINFQFLPNTEAFAQLGSSIRIRGLEIVEAILELKAAGVVLL